jgi:hypothetical protein
MDNKNIENGYGNYDFKDTIDATSYSNRKEIIQSSTKFSSDCIKTLTLCNTQSITLTQNENNLNIKHLNLLTFKVTPCLNSTCKNIKMCPFYHNETDRRRSLVHFKYVSE